MKPIITEASKSNDWATPRPLVCLLDAHFGPFDLDAAAAPWNAVCSRYVTKRDNVLKNPPRARRVWLNPPYSRGMLDKFVGLARKLVLSGHWGSCTLLVPHYSSEGWWQRHVARPEGRPSGADWLWGRIDAPLRHHVRLKSEGLTVDVLEPEGRVRFVRLKPEGRKGQGAAFASAVVHFQTSGRRSA